MFPGLARASFGSALIMICAPVLGQDEADSAVVKTEVFGYVETYFAYEIGGTGRANKPDLLYNHNRLNEVNVNLGLVHVEHTRDRMRAAGGLMVGTYPQYNLAHEPSLLRNIYEARVGVKLSAKRDLWLDAGIFPSHIGMESAIGIDNLALTRAINAENSPYYVSGAKLTWTISPKLEVAALYVNGWQRIQRVQQNTPCFGTRVLWTVHEGLQVNWSTFVGSDTPDSLGLYRVFNNVWCGWAGSKWDLKVVADIGVQEPVNGTTWDTWAGGAAVIRRKVRRNVFVVGRGEYYADPEQVIISTSVQEGLSTFGYSLGLDFEVMTDAYLRLEGRSFHATEKVFGDGSAPSRENASITASMAIRF